MADEQSPTLWEQFSKGFADAVADIREKVVEEPWYGRVVTERDASAPQWPQAREEQLIEPVEPERDLDCDKDKGIDR
jgi:hypothetical protein